MPAVWLISDTHFGHEKTCTVFKRMDGSPLRPFSSAEEMDEEMVKRWNDRVRPKDKVYHLGDVVISRKSLQILSRLNGDRFLFVVIMIFLNLVITPNTLETFEDIM